MVDFFYGFRCRYNIPGNHGLLWERIPSPTFPNKNLINIKLERKFSQSLKKNRITRKQNYHKMLWKKPDVKKRTHNYPPKKKVLKTKKHLKILGDPLSTELNPGSTHRHPHPGVHGALQPDCPEKKRRKVWQSQQKPRERGGKWQDFFVDFGKFLLG